MGWNYRVIKDLDGNFKIVEVHYENGKIKGWADSSEDVLIWDNYEDLKGTYDLVKHAFEKPVLERIKDDKLIELKNT